MAPLPHEFDLAVIGGGINGAGIARDAAGRGLHVLLVEAEDLAAHTSSASSKLVHGGLRYLEHGALGLVRKALLERQVLLSGAPHLCRPLRFVMPHLPGLRPAWAIRAGLALYDALGVGGIGRLPRSRGIDLRRDPAGRGLRAGLGPAFEYSDAWVDDARLVVACAVDAAEHGARVLTRNLCTRATRSHDAWHLTLRGADGAQRRASARALVNATGPWADRFLSGVAGVGDAPRLRLVRGSHVVFPRLFAHDRAYVFQNEDRRVVFALPFEGDFTLVGTTDVEHAGDPGAAACSDGEARYLCDALSRYLAVPVGPERIVHRFAGVRPLVDDGAVDAAAVTRDYRLDLDASPGPPLLSVLGGKLTTFRRLAEEAVDLACAALGRPAPGWTAHEPLPGGALDGAPGFDAFLASLRARHAWLSPALSLRLARAYGERALALLDGARGTGDLGEHFGAGLYERELEHLVDAEWARTADDVLWRRSKLGLRLDAAAVAAVASWLDRRCPGGDAAR